MELATLRTRRPKRDARLGDLIKHWQAEARARGFELGQTRQRMRTRAASNGRLHLTPSAGRHNGPSAPPPASAPTAVAASATPNDHRHAAQLGSRLGQAIRALDQPAGCPASGSSFGMESASRNDRLPRDRTNRMAPSPRSPEAASTAGAFFSNLDRCLADDPMLAGIRFRGHRQGSGRATSPAWTVPGKRNESLASIDGKNCIFQTYTRPTPARPWHHLHCHQSRSLPSARVTSDVNGVLRRKIVSPQWDRSARSSRRQHQRCIGCEKTCFLP
jgi:hypothetical protein